MTDNPYYERYLKPAKSATDYRRKELFALMDQAESQFAAGKFEAAAQTYRESAEAYRYVCARVQTEFIESSYSSAQYSSTVDVYRQWFRKFHRRETGPFHVAGLTKEQLWEIVGELEQDPRQQSLFAEITEQHIRAGDLMTWKTRARYRMEDLFGFGDHRRIALTIAEELLVDLVRQAAVERANESANGSPYESPGEGPQGIETSQKEETPT
ncbi:MAG: hypothetical protein ACFHX7_07830 [Pseudomonadota bacterium]